MEPTNNNSGATGVALTDRIRCGIAGWSYPDWEGTVYPRGLKDPLRFIAAYVDVIEVNSTFYRPPTARQTESWLERVADNAAFFFTVKLHQEITHQAVITPQMSNQFHEALAPLVAAGKLKHLLAQFKYDFDDGRSHRDHLTKIADRFGDIATLAVEVRHASWAKPEALEWMRSLRVTMVNLDYPLGRHSFDMDRTGIGEQAYFRLHGRNTAAWFDKMAGRDQTYDYYYPKPEIEGLCRRACAIAEQASQLTVIANNHFRGKEVANALQLKSALTGRKLKVPPLLLNSYPDLRDVALPEDGCFLSLS